MSGKEDLSESRWPVQDGRASFRIWPVSSLSNGVFSPSRHAGGPSDTGVHERPFFAAMRVVPRKSGFRLSPEWTGVRKSFFYFSAPFVRHRLPIRKFY